MIVEGGKPDGKRLNDLKPGDVFRWDFSGGGGDIGMKTHHANYWVRLSDGEVVEDDGDTHEFVVVVKGKFVVES